MTAEERSRVTYFLARFNRIEAQLRRKLGPPRNRGFFAELIKQFDQAFPDMIDVERLRTIASIRNALVQETLGDGDFCVVPTRTLLRQLDAVGDRLIAPLRVLPTFQKKVEFVSVDDALRDVLRLVAARDYSQFPVYSGKTFKGLLTENGITRWLGACAKHRQLSGDFASAAVHEILVQEESQDTCAFVSGSEEVQAVRNNFANHYLLEAVLITDNGTARGPLKGIITRWDMLR